MPDKNISESQLIRMIVDNLTSMDTPELLVDVYNKHLSCGVESHDKMEYVGRDESGQRVYRHVKPPYDYDYSDPITV